MDYDGGDNQFPGTKLIIMDYGGVGDYDCRDNEFPGTVLIVTDCDGL